MRVFPDIPKIIGHRGAAADAPENTLLSIRTARDQGVRMVEFDVKLTGGAVPTLILMHDETLERTSNGTGLVRDYDYVSLQKLDAGQGEKIPTLAQTIGLLTKLDLAANIEIKPCAGRAVETAAATIAVLQECWPEDKPWPILSSFDIDVLATCQRLWPECPRGLLIGLYRPDWQKIMQALEVRTLHIGHRHANDLMMAEYIRAGVPVLVYTVNDLAQAQHLWAMGVAGVFSDCPGILGNNQAA